MEIIDSTYPTPATDRITYKIVFTNTVTAEKLVKSFEEDYRLNGLVSTPGTKPLTKWYRKAEDDAAATRAMNAGFCLLGLALVEDMKKQGFDEWGDVTEKALARFQEIVGITPKEVENQNNPGWVFDRRTAIALLAAMRSIKNDINADWQNAARAAVNSTKTP